MPTTQSPSHVKDHNEITLHRESIVAADAVITAIGKKLGMNMAGVWYWWMLWTASTGL